MTQVHYTRNAEMYRAFKNQTFPGHNEKSTMHLVELGDGSLALLDYNWCKLADVTRDGQIRVFSGWSQWAKERFAQEYAHGGEPTTARHTRELIEYLLSCGRDFEVLQEAPTVGTPPESLRSLGRLNMIPDRGTSDGQTE